MILITTSGHRLQISTAITSTVKRTPSPSSPHSTDKHPTKHTRNENSRTHETIAGRFGDRSGKHDSVGYQSATPGKILDRPLTGIIVIGGIFLFATLSIVAAVIVFCRKKNTVFVLDRFGDTSQRSTGDDIESDYELDDLNFGSDDGELSDYSDSPKRSRIRMNGELQLMLPLHYSEPNLVDRSARRLPRKSRSIHNSTVGSCGYNRAAISHASSGDTQAENTAINLDTRRQEILQRRRQRKMLYSSLSTIHSDEELSRDSLYSLSRDIMDKRPWRHEDKSGSFDMSSDTTVTICLRGSTGKRVIICENRRDNKSANGKNDVCMSAVFSGNSGNAFACGDSPNDSSHGISRSKTDCGLDGRNEKLLVLAQSDSPARSRSFNRAKHSLEEKNVCYLDDSDGSD